MRIIFFLIYFDFLNILMSKVHDKNMGRYTWPETDDPLRIAKCDLCHGLESE